jgi:hypothetical protein
VRSSRSARCVSRDRTADKRHTKAFYLYASAIGSGSLEEIVDYLEQGVEGGARVVFHRFPVSDSAERPKVIEATSQVCKLLR